ncbi:hypothetical protein BC936DRAFT_149008, partial [Jimgerdemannia flammicorona]
SSKYARTELWTSTQHPIVDSKTRQRISTNHTTIKTKRPKRVSPLIIALGVSISAVRPGNPIIPDYLQENVVHEWSDDDVVAFLRANLKTLRPKDAQIQIFKERKIGGSSLLLTKDEFLIQPFELKFGPTLFDRPAYSGLEESKGDR